MNTMNNTSIAYFRTRETDASYVCVALLRPEKGSSSKTYQASFSFYSPHHELKGFSKKVARNIALGRMEKSNPNHIEFQSDNKNLTQLFLEALHNGKKMGILPHWVTKAAKKNELFIGLNQKDLAQRFVESEKAVQRRVKFDV